MLSTATTESPSSSAVRVLVVDDDEMVGRALSRVLHPFEVTFANGAAAALAHLRSGEAFSAIVCDMLMPGMNGIQFYQELAAAFPGLERTIVFVTGHRTSPVVADFLAHVSNACLDKPFDLAALKAAIVSASARV
jgi:CheY-like chemotaxis protein